MPPRQLAPPEVELTAAALGDARRDDVGVVSDLEPDVEVQPVLRRPLGGRLGAQLQELTENRITVRPCQTLAEGITVPSAMRRSKTSRVRSSDSNATLTWV